MTNHFCIVNVAGIEFSGRTVTEELFFRQQLLMHFKSRHKSDGVVSGLCGLAARHIVRELGVLPLAGRIARGKAIVNLLNLADGERVAAILPVSSLDVSIQAQVLNLLMDLQDQMGVTYMFVTHDLSVVRHISNNICVMYLGEVVEMSPSKELFSNSLHPYTKALLSAIPSVDIDQPMQPVQLKGELTSPINPKPGCRFFPRCPYARGGCSEQPQQLEEVSPQHYVACCRVHDIND